MNTETIHIPVWKRLATLLATGLGVGASPIAPGTVGTLSAWVWFALLQPHMSDTHWAITLALSIPLGIWVSCIAADVLQQSDPSAVVIDEILAFWLVLWLVTPCSLWQQCVAFALFRFFDAVKPGPVGWADRLFHHVDPRSSRRAWWLLGTGIMLDDFVAAGCTLLVMAWWRFI